METTKTILKPKLTFDEMIKHMEDKNIQFNLISQDKAQLILKDSNYFFKVLSYRKNFTKNQKDKYINLDFGLLTDLATIDMRLRYIVLQMCLDIEHRVKTKILTDITYDEKEDGYSIVQDFFSQSGLDIDYLLKPLKRESNYNFGLYNTYGDKPPVWVLFEIISFGSFVRFVEFYYKRTNKKRDYKMLYKLLRYVKNIRNSAAHNSPLLMNMVGKNQLNAQPENFVSTYISKVPGISKEVRKKRLTNRKMHDLTVLLAVHDTFIDSKPMKKARYQSLKELLDRSMRNQIEYKKHPALVSVFNYFNKIVDFLNLKL